MNSLWILLACGLTCAYAQPSCNPDLLKKCNRMDELKNFEVGDDYFPNDPAKLQEICGHVIPMLECKLNVMDKCPGIVSQRDKDDYRRTKHLVVKVCNPGDFQTKYLRNGKCMSGVFVTKQNFCKERAEDKVALGPCPYFKALQSCISTSIRNSCGSDAAEIYEEHFVPLYGNGVCDEY